MANLLLRSGVHMRFPALPIRASSLACVLLIAAGLLRTTAPVQANDQSRGDSISSGRATFQQFCAPCHGPTGKGNGAVASYLLKTPSDVTQLRRRYNGVFPKADLEAVLLATSRDRAPRALADEEILWGPLFLSLGPDSARVRVAELIAFLESVQER